MKLIICFFISLLVFISSPSFAEQVDGDPCETVDSSRAPQGEEGTKKSEPATDGDDEEEAG